MLRIVTSEPSPSGSMRYATVPRIGPSTMWRSAILYPGYLPGKTFTAGLADGRIPDVTLRASTGESVSEAARRFRRGARTSRGSLGCFCLGNPFAVCQPGPECRRCAEARRRHVHESFERCAREIHGSRMPAAHDSFEFIAWDPYDQIVSDDAAAHPAMEEEREPAEHLALGDALPGAERRDDIGSIQCLNAIAEPRRRHISSSFPPAFSEWGRTSIHPFLDGDRAWRRRDHAAGSRDTVWPWRAVFLLDNRSVASGLSLSPRTAGITFIRSFSGGYDRHGPARTRLTIGGTSCAIHAIHTAEGEAI